MNIDEPSSDTNQCTEEVPALAGWEKRKVVLRRIRYEIRTVKWDLSRFGMSIFAIVFPVMVPFPTVERRVHIELGSPKKIPDFESWPSFQKLDRRSKLRLQKLMKKLKNGTSFRAPISYSLSS